MAFAGALRRLTAATPLELERWVHRRSGPGQQAAESLAARLVSATGAVGLVSHHEVTLSCHTDRLCVVLSRLKRFGFEQLIDIDLRTASKTTWLVHHLLSLSLNARVRVRSDVHGVPLPRAGLLYANAVVLEGRLRDWGAHASLASSGQNSRGRAP